MALSSDSDFHDSAVTERYENRVDWDAAKRKPKKSGISFRFMASSIKLNKKIKRAGQIDSETEKKVSVDDHLWALFLLWECCP